ncbi:hypothetical protein MHF_1385 [Mycoplasma haemofelis Ohio2]|uniref:Uncharacterized protein n=1 Tax=Mycoplasma haemofelis (strain Ohio2) TaxID=859194 RepID=F6FGI3_MYCHI|nr:hypothetical protein MHF_1385 [Mycoplasma haemofelis Ohio2]
MKPIAPILGGASVIGAGVIGAHLSVAPNSKTEVVKEEGEVENVNQSSTWKGPRFLSKHHFSNLEYSSENGFSTTFKESVDGLDPKVKGKYYVEWVSDDWENHVKNLNSRNEDSAVKAIFKNTTLSPESLKNVCDSYANKKLEVVGNNRNFTFKAEGKTVNSLKDLEEWKNAVLVCTRTFSLGDYMQKAFPELTKDKEVITRAEDISNGSLQLRAEDEATNKNTSMTYGREFLQDRLRGLDDEEAKKQIFEWCQHLGEKAAPTGTWNNDKDNFKTFCMKSKGASPEPSLSKVRDSKGKGNGTVGDYFDKEYLGPSGVYKNKRMVSSAQEISNSVWSLRQDDERNYESSIGLGKEFLNDRLKEKSLELVKEEVFKWCEFLRTRPDSLRERNIHNLATYCLVEKK